MLDVCFLKDQFNFYFQAEICKTELIWTGYYGMPWSALFSLYTMDGWTEREGFWKDWNGKDGYNRKFSSFYRKVKNLLFVFVQKVGKRQGGKLRPHQSIERHGIP